MVVIGKTYKHHKGHLYKVLALARHSETLEDMVVYQRVGDESDVWVRPLDMFEEVVEIDGKKIKRFELMD